MSTDAPSGQRPRALLVYSVVLAGVISLAATAANIASTSFREIYTGFGAELPPITQIVLGGLWAWTLLALAGVGNAIWVASTPRAPGETFSRMWVIAVSLTIVVSVAMAISIVALYLPIFTLGSVV